MGVPDQGGRDDAAVVLFDSSVHPEQAVLRACYALADKAEFSVSRSDATTLKVTFEPAVTETAAKVATALRTAVIDFSVRADIETRTASLRDAIWRTAFAECVEPRDRS
jgi:His-Xaa-Ser system protein HxsD